MSAEALAESVHGFLECLDCHTGAEQVPHEAVVETDGCSTCHEEVAELYAESIHGRARQAGALEAPDCTACHREIHTLVPRSDPASSIHPSRLPETCGACHANPEMVAKFHIPIARPLEAYRESVHARAVAEGKAGPSCNNCHGSHGIFPAGSPRSSVSHERVLDTCGVCHGEITERFRRSVHGVAVAEGIREAPVCTDCHGEHRILSPEEPGSPVFPTNIPLQTCGRCHSDIRLNEKYGLASDKVPAYEDSYHGLAARSGVQHVANCASCHGVHDILPSSDPESHVYPANLPATCGQCHPGAGTRFAIGPVHVLPTEARFAGIYWIRLLYLPLIYLTIAGMMLHNLLDLIRKTRHPPIPDSRVPVRERMSTGFRVAHMMVMISFALLVYTGFALVFPESWWARPLLHWENGLGLRGVLHRGAAVLLLGGLAIHVVHLMMSRRARACMAGMMPRLTDWREFRERMEWYLGRRELPPQGGKLSYVEKVEYLAFLWGMVVMAVTGFLLWFENPALRWFPKWVTDAATAVHFYEAILASLAILVWHLYWVIFDPVVYPMDTAWWTGKELAGRAEERSEPRATEVQPARRKTAR